ncbi:MAG: hypothetical protein IJ085_05145, partial [Turicibacter sp.]|nr:hypothetical protein [Turicibacter sp.]
MDKTQQYIERLVQELIPQYGELAINLKLKEVIIEDLTMENQALMEMVQQLEYEVEQLKEERETLQKLVGFKRG